MKRSLPYSDSEPSRVWPLDVVEDTFPSLCPERKEKKLNRENEICRRDVPLSPQSKVVMDERKQMLRKQRELDNKLLDALFEHNALRLIHYGTTSFDASMFYAIDVLEKVREQYKAPEFVVEVSVMTGRILVRTADFEKTSSADIK